MVGILAGVLWSKISPHAQGVVVSKSEIIPFEQENWIAADGRFVIITAVIGLVIGAAAWFWRAQRGPVLVAGLAVGAGLGALLTALVGYWLSSGHDSGAVNTQIRLRVHVHAHGLIALEAVLALAAYLVGVLFSGPDDLGRPSTSLEPEPVGVGAVGPGVGGLLGSVVPRSVVPGSAPARPGSALVVLARVAELNRSLPARREARRTASPLA